jgi:lipopolysaccharide/colanic/teichoic acid biosynthesis glycosyltransferase
MYNNFLKRIFDFCFALLALFLLFPIFFAVSVLLYLHQKTVFFSQDRPGKNKTIFKLVKFKSMNDKCDAFGKLLPDIERLTRIGKFVRSTSLDELPQLWNVLKGDMSLIGPRPLLVKYLPLYSKEQARRHEVRPGITGWAQVNGRNAISWDKKFELDVWYVDNVSFLLDMKIMLLTVKKVFIREGINNDEAATMPPFTGT